MLVERKRLLDGSGGPGRRRGGMGSGVTVRKLDEDGVVHISFDGDLRNLASKCGGLEKPSSLLTADRGFKSLPLRFPSTMRLCTWLRCAF